MIYILVDKEGDDERFEMHFMHRHCRSPIPRTLD